MYVGKCLVFIAFFFFFNIAAVCSLPAAEIFLIFILFYLISYLHFHIGWRHGEMQGDHWHRVVQG